MERLIEISSHLKTLRDFRTLETLVSVVRAIAGQTTNITGINWKVDTQPTHIACTHSLIGYS